MTILTDELPFVTEALEIYVKETYKRMEQIKPFVLEHNRLKRRIKIANERLATRK